MEPFIQSDQFNYIKYQTEMPIKAYSTVNDINVLNAQKSLSQERVFNLFHQLNGEQRELLKPIAAIRERENIMLPH
ncbi:hypothetical protein JOD43_001054 [Pullulanibacillus pueri]|uniref:Elongation factor G-binding protein N-terminal domain-containing protein n=1 Tax=Pullulanibacillus pueri TaxID=1437324 RepID=A0A8J3ELJ0_9BACL|nr:hypothetical protein [Pullulanibacillus pueri]MBM7680888.1 hypothetical protein [Pullulanibacillus pueri]GGH81218.1 hypothetical protein GCM10007096_18790 [Pullulanibacillus pueri]